MGFANLNKVSGPFKYPYNFSLANFFKIYFDINYLLLCSPFRIVVVNFNRGTRYRIKTWWPQKILCGCFTLLTIYWIIQGARPPPRSSKSSSKNPAVLFEIAYGVLNALLLLIFVKNFWWDQTKFLKILNFLVENFDTEYRPVSKLTNILFKVGISVVCLLYTAVGLRDAISERDLLRKSEFCEKIFVADTFDNASSINDSRARKDEILFWDKLVCVTLNVGWFHRRIFGAHSEALPLVCAFTVWATVKQFISSLNNPSFPTPSLVNGKEHIRFVGQHVIIQIKNVADKHNWNEIRKQYTSLKILCDMVNSAYGINISCFMVVGILEYAMGLDQLFVEDTSSAMRNSIPVIFYFFDKLAIIVLSADACRQMQSFKQWLCAEENRIDISSDQLSILINELDTNVVSIKASNIFPVTYGLAVNLVGITVTYFIICAQV